MYPYRSNTNIYQKNTSLNTRETTLSVTKEDLKQDKRLLELLEIAQQETIQSLSAFDALIKNEALQSDIETLRNAYLDEIKHLKHFWKIFLYTTNRTTYYYKNGFSKCCFRNWKNITSRNGTNRLF